jgi:hypothetical protein
MRRNGAPVLLKNIYNVPSFLPDKTLFCNLYPATKQVLYLV